MIKKLNRNLVDFQSTSVYDFNELTLQDLLSKFFDKINNCIDVSNQALSFLEWLKEEGLPIEVQKEIEKMYLDGRLTEIINKLADNVNEKVDNVLLYQSDKPLSDYNKVWIEDVTEEVLGELPYVEKEIDRVTNKLNEINTTVSTKLNEVSSQLEQMVINVKTLGAIGDYNFTTNTGTDNLQFFNKALEKVKEGGTIYIPDGKYLLSDNWLIDKENIEISLSPHACIITNNITTTGGCIQFMGYVGQGTNTTPKRKKCRIYGGSIATLGGNNNTNAIGCCRYENFIVENVTILNSDRKGITAQYGVDNVIIRDCIIENSLNHGITIEVECKSGIIENNKINTLSNGINVTTSVNNVEIKNNIINSENYGIYTNENCYNLNINNNNIKAQRGIVSYNNSILIIKDNRFKCTQNTLFIDGCSNGLIIEDNTFIENGSVEIATIQKCICRPQISRNTVLCSNHTYVFNFSTMNGYQAIMSDNILKKGTNGVINGWKPFQQKDVVDGTSTIVENGLPISYSNNYPLDGLHLKGERVYNTSPTNGGVIGWVCISEGTPGVWRSFGNIENIV